MVEGRRKVVFRRNFSSDTKDNDEKTEENKVSDKQ